MLCGAFVKKNFASVTTHGALMYRLVMYLFDNVLFWVSDMLAGNGEDFRSLFKFRQEKLVQQIW